MKTRKRLAKTALAFVCGNIHLELSKLFHSKDLNPPVCHRLHHSLLLLTCSLAICLTLVGRWVSDSFFSVTAFPPLPLPDGSRGLLISLICFHFFLSTFHQDVNFKVPPIFFSCLAGLGDGWKLEILQVLC